MLFENAVKFTQMAKLTDIQHVIALITIRIDDTVRLDLLTDNRQ